MRATRPISWIKAARKDFEAFPQGAQIEIGRALTIVAEGRYPDIAKPLKGAGSGVFELALRHRGEAFRVVYAVQIRGDIWVVHAFQKKSKTGIKTPKAEIDLIHERLNASRRCCDERRRHGAGSRQRECLPRLRPPQCRS